MYTRGRVLSKISTQRLPMMVMVMSDGDVTVRTVILGAGAALIGQRLAAGDVTRVAAASLGSQMQHQSAGRTGRCRENGPVLAVARHDCLLSPACGDRHTEITHHTK